MSNSEIDGLQKSGIKDKTQNKRRSSSGCFAPFKSPSVKKSKSVSPSSSTNKVTLAQEVLSLHETIKQKEKEIQKLNEDYSQSELQEHIVKLHDYNEIKDVAQMVIGKLAEQRSTTTKELYSYFNLDLDD